MTTNNEKMSAEEIARLIMAIAMDDKNNPFVVGFSTNTNAYATECTCDECKYADLIAIAEADYRKDQAKAQQVANFEYNQAMKAVKAPTQFPIEMKMPKGWTVESFMATSPSKENVMDMCCQIANLYNCDITDTFFFEMFESLLALRTEGLFFDDRYSAGYHDACLLGVVNWKIAKGNEKLIALNADFDKFVEVAHTLNAPKERLEKLFPYRK